MAKRILLLDAHHYEGTRTLQDQLRGDDPHLWIDLHPNHVLIRTRNGSTALAKGAGFQQFSRPDDAKAVVWVSCNTHRDEGFAWYAKQLFENTLSLGWEFRTGWEIADIQFGGKGGANVRDPAWGNALTHLKAHKVELGRSYVQNAAALRTAIKDAWLTAAKTTQWGTEKDFNEAEENKPYRFYVNRFSSMETSGRKTALKRVNAKTVTEEKTENFPPAANIEDVDYTAPHATKEDETRHVFGMRLTLNQGTEVLPFFRLTAGLIRSGDASDYQYSAPVDNSTLLDPLTGFPDLALRKQVVNWGMLKPLLTNDNRKFHVLFNATLEAEFELTHLIRVAGDIWVDYTTNTLKIRYWGPKGVGVETFSDMEDVAGQPKIALLRAPLVEDRTVLQWSSHNPEAVRGELTMS